MFCAKALAQGFNYVSPDMNYGAIHFGINGKNNNIKSFANTVKYTDSIPFVHISIIQFDNNGNILSDTAIGSIDSTYVLGYPYNNTFETNSLKGEMRYPNQPQKPYKQFAYFINQNLTKSQVYLYQSQNNIETPIISSSKKLLPNLNACLLHVQDSNGSASSKARLILIDTLNNIILNKSYSPGIYWNIPTDVFKYNDFYYLIINKVQINNSNNPTNLLIYKLDTLGNIIDTYQTTGGKWYGAESSAVLPNGDFIIGGFYSKGFITSNTSDGIWQQKYLARYDKNLNLIWRKTFGITSANAEIVKVMIAADNTIVGCGTDGLVTFNGTINIGHGTGCLFKFSLDGDSIWMRKYQATDDSQYGELAWMTYMDELPNNQGFVGCGYVDNIIVGRRGWVFKTDANGCLDASCTDDVTEVNENEEVFVYPNPATDLLYISNPSQIYNYQLFQLDGKLIFQGNTFPIDISELPKGIYFIRITTKNDRIINKKIIKQ